MSTTTLTRENEDDGTEYDVVVTYTVSKFYPGVRTLRNGDPGYPDEGGEVEVLSAIRQDTMDEVELTDSEVESIAVDAETDDDGYEPEDDDGYCDHDYESYDYKEDY